MDSKAGLPRLDRVERGEHLDVLGRDSDLLLGFTQRGRQEVMVARLRSTTGEPDLTAVDAAVGAHEQEDPENALRIAKHGCQNGRVLERRRGQTSARRRSAIVSRVLIRRASPPPTSTAAGRVTPL